jgi:hypothetical protein
LMDVTSFVSVVVLIRHEYGLITVYARKLVQESTSPDKAIGKVIASNYTYDNISTL